MSKHKLVFKIIALVTIQIFTFTTSVSAYPILNGLSKVKKELRAPAFEENPGIKDGFLARLGVEAGDLKVYLPADAQEVRDKIEQAVKIVKAYPDLELPRNLGKVNFTEEIEKKNIVRVEMGERSPPGGQIAHAGVKFEVLYLLLNKTDILNDRKYSSKKLAALLSEELYELIGKERAVNKNLKWDEKLAREVHQSYYSKTAKLKKIPKGIAAGLLVSAVLPGGGEKETDGEKGKHEIGGDRVPIRFVPTRIVGGNIFAQSFRDKIAQKEIKPTQAKERLPKENIPEDFIDSNTGSMPSEHTEKESKPAQAKERLLKENIPEDFIDSIIGSMPSKHTEAETVPVERLVDQVRELYELLQDYRRNPDKMQISIENPKNIYYKDIPEEKIPSAIDYTEIMIVGIDRPGFSSDITTRIAGCNGNITSCYGPIYQGIAISVYEVRHTEWKNAYINEQRKNLKTALQTVEEPAKINVSACLNKFREIAKIREEGKNWDVMVITVGDGASRERIRRFFVKQKGALYQNLNKEDLEELDAEDLEKIYNTEVIIIVEKTRLGNFLGSVNANNLGKQTLKERYFAKGIFDLPFDKFASFFKLNSDEKKEIFEMLGSADLNKAPPRIKTQIFEYIWNNKIKLVGLHTAGMAKRLQPLSLSEDILGNKTFFLAIKKEMLEQVIKQSFSVYNDTPGGTSTWLAADDIWLPSGNCRGGKQAIQVYAIEEELTPKHQTFGVMKISSDGRLEKSFEKENYEKVLVPAFPEKKVYISLWNNRSKNEVMDYETKIYSDWIAEGRQLDFMGDFVTAILSSWKECNKKIEEWRRGQRRTEEYKKGDYTEREIQQDAKRMKENWRRTQKIKKKFGEIGGINMGKGALWMPMGKLREVHSIYTQAPHNPVLRELLEVQTNVVNSPYVEEAIKEGNLIVEKGVVIIDSDIREGILREGTVVRASVIKSLETQGDCIVWGINAPDEEIKVEPGMVICDVPYEKNKFIRVDWPLDKSPSEFWKEYSLPHSLSLEELTFRVQEFAQMKFEITSLVIQLEGSLVRIGYGIAKEDEKGYTLVKVRDYRWREMLKEEGVIIDEEGNFKDKDLARKIFFNLLEEFTLESFDRLQEIGIEIKGPLKLECVVGASIEKEEGVIKGHRKFFDEPISIHDWMEISLAPKLGIEKMHLDLRNDAEASALRLGTGVSIPWTMTGIGLAAVEDNILSEPKEYLKSPLKIAHRLIAEVEKGKIKRWRWAPERMPGTQGFVKLEKNIDRLEGNFSLEEWMSTYLAWRYLKYSKVDSPERLIKDSSIFGEDVIADFKKRHIGEEGVDKFVSSLDEMTLEKLKELISSGHNLAMSFVVESISYQALKGPSQIKEKASQFLAGLWQDFGGAIRVWSDQFQGYKFSKKIVFTGELGRLLGSEEGLDSKGLDRYIRIFKEASGIADVSRSKKEYFDEVAAERFRLWESTKEKILRLYFPTITDRVEAIEEWYGEVIASTEQSWPDFTKKALDVTFSSGKRRLFVPVANDVSGARLGVSVIKKLLEERTSLTLPIVPIRKQVEFLEFEEDSYFVKVGDYFFVLFDDYPGTEPLSLKEQGKEQRVALGRLIASFYAALKEFKPAEGFKKREKSFIDIVSVVHRADLSNLWHQLKQKESGEGEGELTSAENRYLDNYGLIQRQLHLMKKESVLYDELPKAEIVNNYIAFPSVIPDKKGNLKLIDFSLLRTNQPIIEELGNAVTSRVLYDPRAFSKDDLLAILAGLMEKYTFTDEELLLGIERIRASFLWDVVNRPLNHMDKLNKDAFYLKTFEAHLDLLAKIDKAEGEFYMFKRDDISDRRWLEEVKVYKLDANISHTGDESAAAHEKVNNVIAQAKKEGRLVLVRTGAAEKLKFWGKIFAYINNELRRVKIFDLRDLKNKRAVIINYQMLLDNPGIALAVKNINQQLGKKKGLKLVLALDDTKREKEFYETVYKATDGLTDLNGQFDKVVSAKEKPEKIIRKIKMEFPEVEKIEVIGPQVWVVPYRMEQCIIVICEIGEGNKISQGDLALLVGLDALVSKGVLTSDEEKALSRRGVNEKGNFFAIESKEVGKEMQYIEKYQEEMKKYE